MGTNGIFAHCSPAKQKSNKRSLDNRVGVCSVKVGAKNLQLSHYSGLSERLGGQGKAMLTSHLRDKAWLSDYYYNNNQPFYFKRVGRLRKI